MACAYNLSNLQHQAEQIQRIPVANDFAIGKREDMHALIFHAFVHCRHTQKFASVRSFEREVVEHSIYFGNACVNGATEIRAGLDPISKEGFLLNCPEIECIGRSSAPLFF